MIDKHHSQISVRRQCELLDISRSRVYYKSKVDNSYNETLKRLLDKQYTSTPFYGASKMTESLNSQGYPVNHKRVSRLMKQMGISAIYPKPKTSQPTKDHLKFPCLIRNLKIDRVDQVWSTDITYIPLAKGFIYLTAIMDWYSRFVLSWQYSNTLDTNFCVTALNQALQIGQPEIFNSDQGTQYTSNEFIKRLKQAEIQISMCGKGRVFDNIFVERLWRSLKYEDVYIYDYNRVTEAKHGIDNYLNFYNDERFHEALDYKTPREVYQYGRKGVLSTKTDLLEGSGLRPPPSSKFHLIER